MRQIYQSLVLVVVVLLLAVYSVIPPKDKLRLGKDLRGGVSLVYSVEVDANEDAKSILSNVIDVLKKRVDPDGLMEISMVAQGRDRIEITMPLPNEEVKALKKAFEDRLAAMGQAALSEARLERVMRLPAPERDAGLADLADKNEARLRLLKAAAAAYDSAVQSRAAYDALTDQAAKEAMAADVATAELAYDQAREAVLRTAVSAQDIRHIVQSSSRQRTIAGDDGNRITLESPRKVAETKLIESHPEAVDEINEVLALWNAYETKRTTLDDPADLMRMLKGAGVLSFRITVDPGQHPDESRLRQELQEVGPRNVRSIDAKWYKVNSIDAWIRSQADAEAVARGGIPAPLSGYVVEPYLGDYYMLCWDTRGTRLTASDGTWSVADARQGSDEVGKAAINFEMSPSGAVLLGNLTRDHVQDSMAVLLDDEVYTAPNLLSEISRNGQIKGDFSDEEIRYVVRVLSGGSLQNKLSSEPISVSSVGPELGFDNLQMGLKSGLLSVVLVAGFMLVYYFGCGFVAVTALAVNAALLLGAMAIARASFTMPGIAGMILAFAMAVDSNVLVYERMREELLRGADLKAAVRLGFDRALASIVDGNITNLIVCVVLYYTGTPEIRGFAITMGIGVVTTLFAALVVSRLVFDLMVAAGKRKVSMLPMAVPAIQRFLEPRFDWLRYRNVFFAVSALYVLLGLGLVVSQGSRMLDNEFLGGTQVTVQFAPKPEGGGRIALKRREVEDRVQAIAAAVPEGDQLKDLQFAEVFPIDPQADGVTSDRFIIKTKAENASAVVQAVTERFADVMEIKPPLMFTGSDRPDAAAPVYPVEKPVLGVNIDQPLVRNNVGEYLGGVAIVMDNISPVQSLEAIRQRLDAMRQSAAYSDTLSRRREVIVLVGDESAVTSAAVVVLDETASLFENEARWESEVKAREWSLVQDALTQASTPASVHNFSATIAETFKANAIKAMLLSLLCIGVYIWVRFKTPRYSIAAVVSLAHNVITVVALVALCEIVYQTPATHGAAVAIGLLPFKIDLNQVAAILTIVGYSINDTVVVMDRIRENKGKLPHATAEIINASINQTFSRTIITGGATLGSCLILYVWGGEGMRPFAFTLLAGLVVGTYASVAIAAPLVWSRKHEHALAPAASPTV